MEKQIVENVNTKNACIVQEAVDSDDDGSWVDVMEEEKEGEKECSTGVDEHELSLLLVSETVNPCIVTASDANTDSNYHINSMSNSSVDIVSGDDHASSFGTPPTQDFAEAGYNTTVVDAPHLDKDTETENETKTLRTIEVTEEMDDGAVLVDDKEVPNCGGASEGKCRKRNVTSTLFKEIGKIGKTSQNIVRSAQIKERSQGVRKFLEDTAQNIGETATHIGDEAKRAYKDKDVDLKVKVVAEKAKRGLQTTAEKARQFDEKYHATETIASAAVIAAAAFFSRGNLRTGASVITVAAAAAGIGEGLRASKCDHSNCNPQDKMPY